MGSLKQVVPAGQSDGDPEQITTFGAVQELRHETSMYLDVVMSKAPQQIWPGQSAALSHSIATRPAGHVEGIMQLLAPIILS